MGKVQGDTITLSSSEELREAIQLQEHKDAPLLRLQLTTQPRKQPEYFAPCEVPEKPARSSKASISCELSQPELYRSSQLTSDLGPVLNPPNDNVCSLPAAFHRATTKASRGKADPSELLDVLEEAAVPPEVRCELKLRPTLVCAPQSLDLVRSSPRSRCSASTAVQD